MKVRQLRAADFRRQPWKNGAGLTTELAVHEEGGRFLWRLSVADVERSGPFSDFSGYQRTLMLLEGEGMELTIGAAPPLRIDRPHLPLVFDGGCKTECRVLGRGVRDLNLMVDRLRAAASLAVMRLHDEARIPLVAPWTLLYGLEGTVIAQARRIEHRLEAGELLRIDDAAEPMLTVRALHPGASAALIHIVRL